MTTTPARMPVLTVLLEPGRAPSDPTACRIVKVEATHPGEWPWRRLTGVSGSIPPRDSDLTDWTPQPVGDLASLLGHSTVLTGHEVGR